MSTEFAGSTGPSIYILCSVGLTGDLGNPLRGHDLLFMLLGMMAVGIRSCACQAISVLTQQKATSTGRHNLSNVGEMGRSAMHLACVKALPIIYVNVTMLITVAFCHVNSSLHFWQKIQHCIEAP